MMLYCKGKVFYLALPIEYTAHVVGTEVKSF